MRLELKHLSLAGVFALSAIAISPAALALSPDALRGHLERVAPEAAPGKASALTSAIRDFYARRDYRPLWYTDSRLSRHGTAVLAALAAAEDHGLNPALYGMPQLADRVRAASGDGQADAELALTRAYLEYAADIASGVIDNPRQVGRMFRDAARTPPAQLLDGIAAAPDAAAYLAKLPVDTRRYNDLKAALAKYRQIERSGGWAAISKGPPIKAGFRGPRVAEIKRRLLVTGDLKALGDAEAYDDALVAAVRAFQARHGLAADGNSGADTLAAMNVPVAQRIDQLLINLERRRWLAGHLGPRYLYLNIADNELKIVENDHTIHVARVIVGQPYQQTPIFSAMMTQIEINPYWNVPRSIAVNEMLPSIRRNPGYLSRNGYMLLTRSGDNTSAVNPNAVDWSQIGRGNFPYYIRQVPGANNSLGSLLFRLPNPHNVYLHDTPAKNLFDRDARFFSHGCMRVENPMKMALLLLAGQDGGAWTEARINSIIATRALTVVPLKRPLLVHVTYLTAWAEHDGSVQFRRDPYHRDAAVLAAYKQAVRAR